MKPVREKLLRDNPYPVPVDTGLSPFNTTMNFFHAVVEKDVADVELKVKKIFAPLQNIDTVSKWREIKEKKEDLQQLFVKSNKTIQENKESVSRFMERIREKAEDVVNIEAEILETKNQILEYKEVKTEMETFVNEYSTYENFLRKVIEECPEFNSVGDVLNRYETLEHTRRECTRSMKEGLEETLELRKEMATLMDEKSTRLKILRNRLVMMEGRRKHAGENLKYWENTVQKIKGFLGSREEDDVDFRGSCWDLYRQMCHRRGVPPTAEETDIKAQADSIMKHIIFYKEVLTIATSVRQALLAFEKKVFSKEEKETD